MARDRGSSNDASERELLINATTLFSRICFILVILTTIFPLTDMVQLAGHLYELSVGAIARVIWKEFQQHVS